MYIPVTGQPLSLSVYVSITSVDFRTPPVNSWAATILRSSKDQICARVRIGVVLGGSVAERGLRELVCGVLDCWLVELVESEVFCGRYRGDRRDEMG